MDDWEDIMLNEMSDWERQILYDIIYMWNIKKKNSEHSKKEADTDIENKLVVSSGERERFKRYKLLYIK